MNFHDPKWKKEITISLPAFQWYSIFCTSCLGLKHPSTKEPSRDSAHSFFKKIYHTLAAESLLSPGDIKHISDTFY